MHSTGKSDTERGFVTTTLIVNTHIAKRKHPIWDSIATHTVPICKQLRQQQPAEPNTVCMCDNTTLHTCSYHDKTRGGVI